MGKTRLIFGRLGRMASKAARKTRRILGIGEMRIALNIRTHFLGRARCPQRAAKMSSAWDLPRPAEDSGPCLPRYIVALGEWIGRGIFRPPIQSGGQPRTL